MTRETRMPREEYERRVLQTLRNELLGGESSVERDGRIKIEDVRLDTSGPLHSVHILFRDLGRSRCLFGYWAGAVEDEETSSADPIMLDPQEGYWGPEEWASTIIVTHFEEQLAAVNLGLPPECDPGGITWVNSYRRLPPERARGESPTRLSAGELDELYEDWFRTSEELERSLEARGWLAYGSVGYALAGSDPGTDFRYHVIAYRTSFSKGEQAELELYDEQRGVVAYVSEVPTPAEAVALLGERGVLAEER